MMVSDPEERLAFAVDLTEIQGLKESFSMFEILHVPRTHNKVVHKLA